MIVYVESNFVLEIALLQEQHHACQQILDLARQDKLGLVIPACAITEPFETLVRRERELRGLHNNLLRELAQLSRSKTYSSSKESFNHVTSLLIKSIEEHNNELDRVVAELVSVARIIQTTDEVLKESLELKRTFALSPQDAFVFSSVAADARKQADEKIFLSRNSKDFGKPDVEEELNKLSCRPFWSFDDALDYVRSRLK